MDITVVCLLPWCLLRIINDPAATSAIGVLHSAHDNLVGLNTNPILDPDGYTYTTDIPGSKNGVNILVPTVTVIFIIAVGTA